MASAQIKEARGNESVAPPSSSLPTEAHQKPIDTPTDKAEIRAFEANGTSVGPLQVSLAENDDHPALSRAEAAAVYTRALQANAESRFQDAARDFTLAADSGNAHAQFWIGHYYNVGKGGLPLDEAKATYYYRLAANNGNAAGQVNLGVRYERGIFGVRQDVARAAELYKKSADQGNSFGQCMLGNLYIRGVGGLPKDLKLANELYKQASKDGVKPALDADGCSLSERK
jgi:TPR repeat protein